MIHQLFEKKEKKVEYIELIYDLIFVYIIGRNNSLLHITENGFVNYKAFLAYVLCTLAVIQIWNYTTFYINMFGRKGVRDHIFLFVNMYLMYFIAQCIQENFEQYVMQFHIAWGLILVNIGIQYIAEMRNHTADVWNKDICKRMLIPLFCEAAMVFIGGFTTQPLSSVLSAIAILAGIVLTMLGRRKSPGGQIDFAHLTERAMLYVVFTFGEMIIAVASYFNGDGSWNTSAVYFSLMAFLIVAGLFLIYGFVYDNLIDREGNFDGMLYMLIHIFIIFALNNITASLEFMREEKINLFPKMLFMIGSLVAYFVFILLLKSHAKCNCKPTKKFILCVCLSTVIFIVLMIVFREAMAINILISALYVFSVFIIIYGFYAKARQENLDENDSTNCEQQAAR